jgi:two-component system cell cycle sensor histidine kinase/response regulator CckA
MAVQTRNSSPSRGRKLCRLLLDAVNDVVLIIDPKSLRILHANRKATELYGYSFEELVGKNIGDLTRDKLDYRAFFGRASSPNLERTHFSRTGEKLEFLVSLSVIDYWGRKAILSIGCDIRERRQIETAILASEKKFRSYIQHISEIVALIDADGRIRFISPQVERVLGYPVSQTLDRNVFDFIHADEQERARAEYVQTVQVPGEAVPSVLRFKTISGGWVPLEIIANNQLQDPDLRGVIFTARDIRYRRETEEAIRRANADLDKQIEERTMGLARANAALRIENQQRRHTERKLQESLSLLNATLESTADGILVVSSDGKISSFNRKFLDMWHIPHSATLPVVKDQDLLACAIPQLVDPEAFMVGVKNLYAKPEAVSFDVLSLKDGRIFERYSQPQYVGDRIAGRVWSFRDVTQAKRLEEELRQSQKMEAVGRLAGGVAHDFNNLLMLISGYAGQLLEDPTLPDNSKAACVQIVETTRRAAALTRQLLAFSRKHPGLPVVADLNAIISDMDKMLQRLLSNGIELKIKLRPEPLPVYVDPSRIELLIMNLAINARDAMPVGGTLTITTDEEILAGAEPTNQGPVSTSFAVLEVSDTGYGMAPEIQGRIFEPFFTTKEPGKGTGLGLSTAYGIVEQAQGHITVESEPNQGTNFRIYLPKSPAEVSQTASVEEAPQPGAGHETILLVEDEAGIRSMTRVYLEALHYKLLEAANGQEAIRVSQGYRGTIDLIVTDIVMPGMRGDAVVGAIRRDRPNITAVFISGYADARQLDPQITVVEKPFSFPELGRAIRAVLDSHEQAA